MNRGVVDDLRVLVLSAVVLLLGCMHDRQVALHAVTASPSGTAWSQPPTGSGTVGIVSPSDLRIDPSSIGKLRSEGLVEAYLRSREGVTPWVADSVAASLREAGYMVELLNEDIAQRPGVVIDVAVLRACVDQETGGWPIYHVGHTRTDLAVRFEVYREGVRLWHASYAARETFPVERRRSESLDEALMRGALVDVLQQAMPVLTGALASSMHDDGRGTQQ